jgi:hypothetical protein
MKFACGNFIPQEVLSNAQIGTAKTVAILDMVTVQKILFLSSTPI